MDLTLSQLQKLSLDELVKLKEEADESYYNTSKQVLSDSAYDRLVTEIEHRDSSHPSLQKVGAEVIREKVDLPVNGGLPSLAKVKPGASLERFLTKFPGEIIISDKMDGVSALVHNNADTGVINLYTRGDGKKGQNVSKIVPFLIGKHQLPSSPSYFVRGELIIPRAVFEKKLKSKFANSRGAVAGIINSKTGTPSDMKLVDFIAYEVISYQDKKGVHDKLSPKEQIEWLEKNGFKVVPWWTEIEPTEQGLTDLYLNQREECLYDVDGLVIAPSVGVFKRTSENPKHKVAYKPRTSDQGAFTTVKFVEYLPSKDGVLVPLVHLNPINIQGAKVKKATGHNAKFIIDNGIGPGATIEIVRSGDVIPFIMSVPEPAENGPQLPSEKEFGVFDWNDTNTHLVLKNPKDSYAVKRKQWTHFFRKIGVEGVGSSGKITDRLIHNFETIGDVLRANIDDFEEIEGFKRKSAENLYNNIQTALKNASLARIAAASNAFGLGVARKKIQKLLDVKPDIFTTKLNKKQLIDEISEIDGWNTKTAQIFADGLPVFKKFAKESLPVDFSLIDKKESKKANNKKIVKGKWTGKTIVFTGFRNAELEKGIENQGGKVGNSVNKSTDLLLVKNSGELSSKKAQKAEELGVEVLSVEEFSL